mmetsp:Transcript_47818/g.134648  ORF Transcript_47818/g.134648 Transcript_47818/m.134648 type:complete len:566 (+) Transcript_47818:89-1786(+)
MSPLRPRTWSSSAVCRPPLGGQTCDAEVIDPAQVRSSAAQTRGLGDLCLLRHAASECRRGLLPPALQVQRVVRLRAFRERGAIASPRDGLGHRGLAAVERCGRVHDARVALELQVPVRSERRPEEEAQDRVPTLVPLAVATDAEAQVLQAALLPLIVHPPRRPRGPILGGLALESLLRLVLRERPEAVARFDHAHAPSRRLLQRGGLAPGRLCRLPVALRRPQDAPELRERRPGRDPEAELRQLRPQRRRRLPEPRAREEDHAEALALEEVHLVRTAAIEKQRAGADVHLDAVRSNLRHRLEGQTPVVLRPVGQLAVLEVAEGLDDRRADIVGVAMQPGGVVLVDVDRCEAECLLQLLGQVVVQPTAAQFVEVDVEAGLLPLQRVPRAVRGQAQRVAEDRRLPLAHYVLPCLVEAEPPQPERAQEFVVGDLPALPVDGGQDVARLLVRDGTPSPRLAALPEALGVAEIVCVLHAEGLRHFEPLQALADLPEAAEALVEVAHDAFGGRLPRGVHEGEEPQDDHIGVREVLHARDSGDVERLLPKGRRDLQVAALEVKEEVCGARAQ